MLRAVSDTRSNYGPLTLSLGGCRTIYDNAKGLEIFYHQSPGKVTGYVLANFLKTAAAFPRDVRRAQTAVLLPRGPPHNCPDKFPLFIGCGLGLNIFSRLQRSHGYIRVHT